MDERKAILQLRQGNLSGLEVLVRNHQVKAIHAAYLIIQDRAAAEDIVQFSFLKAAERIDQFDTSRPFGPWFYRTVVNAAIKAARRQKNVVSLDTESSDLGWSPADWLADPNPLPDEEVERVETKQAVWKALELLTPNQRAAIVLRYFLGMSEAETSNELRRPLTTVKWWLHAARLRLRSRLHLFRTNETVIDCDTQDSPVNDQKQE